MMMMMKTYCWRSSLTKTGIMRLIVNTEECNLFILNAMFLCPKFMQVWFWNVCDFLRLAITKNGCHLFGMRKYLKNEIFRLSIFTMVAVLIF
jgi:hypothetical protein